MLCDLSLAALFSLNRRAKQSATQSALGITGLHSEHLSPLVAAGWVRTSKGESAHGIRNCAKIYHLTEAGHALCQYLVHHTADLAASELAQGSLAAAKLV